MNDDPSFHHQNDNETIGSLDRFSLIQYGESVTEILSINGSKFQRIDTLAVCKFAK